MQSSQRPLLLTYVVKNNCQTAVWLTYCLIANPLSLSKHYLLRLLQKSAIIISKVAYCSLVTCYKVVNLFKMLQYLLLIANPLPLKRVFVTLVAKKSAIITPDVAYCSLVTCYKVVNLSQIMHAIFTVYCISNTYNKTVFVTFALPETALNFCLKFIEVMLSLMELVPN
jgi:hypothetical protein